MLSMDDAVALVLENNLDIGIARYNLSIADTDILRTRAGAVLLGFNNGILQGTPGGGVGGLRSPVSSYDPILGGTLEIGRAKTLSASSLFGATQINVNTDTANFNYAQGLQWGTHMWLTFNHTHLTSNQRPSSTVRS